MNACLYSVIEADPDRNEEILRDVVHPVVNEVRESPFLHSFFFVRMSEPRWQLRFRVVGESDWIRSEVRGKLVRRLDPLKHDGRIDGYEFTTYEREVDRYGGEEGMELAEKLYTHDTVACLELLRADREGHLDTSRREFNLVLTERLLDLMGFDAETRLVFYRHGHRWATEDGTWQGEDLEVLDRHYHALRDGLLELFSGEQSPDSDLVWGGEIPRRIGEAFIDSVRPIVARILDGHANNRIRQDIVYLAWSYSHLLCNRMGIHSVAEAILRYFMHRFLTDAAALR